MKITTKCNSCHKTGEYTISDEQDLRFMEKVCGMGLKMDKAEDFDLLWAAYFDHNHAHNPMIAIMKAIHPKNSLQYCPECEYTEPEYLREPVKQIRREDLIIPCSTTVTKINAAYFSKCKGIDDLDDEKDIYYEEELSELTDEHLRMEIMASSVYDLFDVAHPENDWSDRILRDNEFIGVYTYGRLKNMYYWMYECAELPKKYYDEVVETAQMCSSVMRVNLMPHELALLVMGSGKFKERYGLWVWEYDKENAEEHIRIIRESAYYKSLQLSSFDLELLNEIVHEYMADVDFNR